ncbi:MAG: curli production assembly protein CsgG [Ignavibacteriales bacterium]|nr:curli production assembly protein CsgG [Ignavibacteriales bacterium]
MKVFLRFLTPFLLTFLFISCATVKPPIIEDVSNTKQIVSKTILNQQERFLKRKVAIARFSNETKYGRGFFDKENEDRLGKQAMDILSSKLVETEKFLLLERSDLDQIAKEKEIANLKSFDIPAEYLIVGSITEFGRKSTSDVGIFSRTKKQTAYAKVSIRLVDVKTSQIIYSEEGEGEAFVEAGTVLGVGETAEYDATLNDKVINAAISKLVNNIVERLLDSPWKSYLIAFEDGNYFIGGGEKQGIKIGDEFDVYKKGNVVKNPQTNIDIELPGKVVGKIKVISTVPGSEVTELSICSKLSGELPLQDFSDYYVQEQ